MDRVRCSSCGGEHDLTSIELSFDRPVAYFDVPPNERDDRIVATDGTVVIDDWTENARFFLRGVIVIPVRGGWVGDGFGWGVWVEVAQAEFERLVAAGNEEDRANEAAICGHLANELQSFPGSFGLPIQLRIQPPETAPLIDVVDLEHALGVSQSQGVYPEDILEWVFPVIHPKLKHPDLPAD